MSVKKLSNVTLIPAVEGISRKLALRRESCYGKKVYHNGYAAQTTIEVPGTTYMGVINQAKKLNGVGTVVTNRLFLRRASVAPESSENQMAVRQAFSNAAPWVNAALRDLSALTANQLKYKAAREDYNKKIAGVSAYGYQNMRGWMFAIAMALVLDPDAELPSNHQLPAFDA